MKKITAEQIILLHEKLIDRYGGTKGLRDAGLLDMSVNAPYQTFDGEELFPDVIAKAVHLCYGLIHNHPFADGNKRIGAKAMLILLLENGYVIDFDEAGLTALILEAAAGTKNEDDILAYVTDHYKSQS